MRIALTTVSALALLVTSDARADVAPDPVETGSMALVALALLALVIVGVVLAIRYLRRARAKAGDQQ